MSANSFKQCLTYVLATEGGFSNNHEDNGGPTNKGITQRVYDAWRKAHGLALRSVALIELGEVAAIYRQQYWVDVKADQLPTGVDYAVFDFAVNSGVSRASQFLQEAVGAVADGHIGLVTLSLVCGVSDKRALIERLCKARADYLRTLHDFQEFGKGWLNRVTQVDARAVRMVGAA